MIEAIKTIKLWQIGVLVGIFVVGIGATYAAYTIVTRSEQPDLGEDQQLIPVTRGIWSIRYRSMGTGLPE